MPDSAVAAVAEEHFVLTLLDTGQGAVASHVAATENLDLTGEATVDSEGPEGVLDAGGLHVTQLLLQAPRLGIDVLLLGVAREQSRRVMQCARRRTARVAIYLAALGIRRSPADACRAQTGRVEPGVVLLGGDQLLRNASCGKRILGRCLHGHF